MLHIAAFSAAPGPSAYITNVELNEKKYSEMGFASKNTQGKRIYYQVHF